ncbi:hypothetical protein O7628_11240 [Micromonospora sp. WMMD956]|uniref:hypothetical protein n=1 Tax=Micromonospora sp. WMMD956 TaxID=3016108 RepID=UPI0024165153|nr:hypothetical protein [Micromonospora sp. WMMD956]MDG4816076.1 hypothetical protein [Micromonospora sp. WMMD956]
MTEKPYKSAPVSDGAYVRTGQITVELPGRHVPPEVVRAAERFARACEAVRRAEAEIGTASKKMRETENRVMGEAYRAVHDEAEIDEDAKLAQSEEWVLAKSAEETASARFHGAKQALASCHAELVAVAANPEWGAYLATQRQALSARVKEDLKRATETLRELEEVEGLTALVAAGGVWQKRRHAAVAPVENEDTQPLRDAQDLLRTVLRKEDMVIRAMLQKAQILGSRTGDKNYNFNMVGAE